MRGVRNEGGVESAPKALGCCGGTRCRRAEADWLVAALGLQPAGVLEGLSRGQWRVGIWRLEEKSGLGVAVKSVALWSRSR